MSPKWSSRFQLKPGKWVFVPTAHSVSVGREIKAAIKKRWACPKHFYHLRRGGHVAAVRAHLSGKSFVYLDVRDFFGSMGRSRVTRCLKSRFGHRTALDWAHASTVRDPGNPARTILPFGFVQSPIVASLCLAESAFGRYLQKLANGKDIRVSVYMDDIILSAENAVVLDTTVVDELTKSAQRSGFSFHAVKTQGPAPAIKAFNIELCHGAIRIENSRMSEFFSALKRSVSMAQRAGILSYIGSVNSDQRLVAETHGRAS